MAVTVKHQFVSNVPDGADPSAVKPSNWNADHEITGLGDMASLPVATKAEAEAGTANDKGMTPLTTAQAIAALAGGGGLTPTTYATRNSISGLANGKTAWNTDSRRVEIYSDGLWFVGGGDLERITFNDFERGAITNIAYGGGRYVMFGDSTDYLAGGVPDPAYSAVSPDLRSWPYLNNSGAAPNVNNGLEWSQDRFFAVNTSSGSMVTSTNGYTWTSALSISSYQQSLGCVIYAHGLYIFATGSNSGFPNNSIATSPDGTTWTWRAITNSASSIWFGCGKSAASGGAATSGTATVILPLPGAPHIQRTTNGTTWTTYSTGLTAGCHAVVWTGTQFLAVGFISSTLSIATSTDGITWTTAAVTFPVANPDASSGVRALVKAGAAIYCVTAASSSAAWMIDPATPTVWKGTNLSMPRIALWAGLLSNGRLGVAGYDTETGVYVNAATSASAAKRPRLFISA